MQHCNTTKPLKRGMMMSRPSSYPVYPFVVITFLFFVETIDGSIFQNAKVHITIINNLPNNQDLTLHCQSKDTDLGIHVLPPKATFNFTFRPRMFFYTTLYFCRVEWPNTLHYFNVYDEKNDLNECIYDCQWSIVSSGPCRYNVMTKKFDTCFAWRSPWRNN